MLNLVQCHTYTRWHGTSSPWGLKLWTVSSEMWSYCCGFPSSWPVDFACGFSSLGGHTSTIKMWWRVHWRKAARKGKKLKAEDRKGERDNCAFEENISRLHGTQANLSPPSSRRTHLSRWKQEPLWGGALALSLHPTSSNWKTSEYGRGLGGGRGGALGWVILASFGLAENEKIQLYVLVGLY